MEKESSLVTVEAHPPASDSIMEVDKWLSADSLLQQTQHVHEIMAKVLREGEHYGTIPGTEKPMLYKSGSEKIAFSFRLFPKYEIKRTDAPDGHREYEITTTLYSIKTGRVMGTGIGFCSTRESKYLYRNAEPEVTDKPLPGKYWDLKLTKKDLKGAQELIGGKGYVPKKKDGKWWIAKLTGAKVLNENPADHYNTVLKMAKKRSHTDAVLSSTAASDIFQPPPPEVDDDEGAGKAGAGEGKGDPPPPGNPAEKGKNTNGTEYLNRARALETENRALFEEACKAAGVDYPMTDTGARKVLDKANEIWKAKNP